MQIHLPIFANNGLSGVEKYIAASDKYLHSSVHYRKMDYEFPNIHQQCPICSAGHCARWKGYYARCLQDSSLGLFQKIAIRYGRCQWFKIEFSFLPDFLLPRRRVSIPTLDALISATKNDKTKLQTAIDDVISSWREDLYLPCSTVSHSINSFITLLKNQYIPTASKTHRVRKLSQPDRFGSDLVFSIRRVLDRLKNSVFVLH